jgi:O-antigen/teichoic acid export membrane protein
MDNRNQELIRNAIILGIGQIVPKLLTLFILPILTAYLSTEEYGSFDLVISIASLIIPLITLQIQQAVFRFLLVSKNRDEKKNYLTNAVLFVFFSSIVGMPFLFIGMRLLHIDNRSALIICFIFMSESLYGVLGQAVRGASTNIKYAMSVIVYSIVNLAMILLFVVYNDMALHGVLLAQMIAYIVADIYMYWGLSERLYFDIKQFSKESIKQLLKFSIPIVPSSISLWIVNFSDRVIIVNSLGVGANGIYSVANKIPSIYSTAYDIFNLAWTETATKVFDDGSHVEYYSSLLGTLYSFLIGVMLLLIAATPVVFRVLVNAQYDAAYYQMLILYFGVFFNSFVNFYSGIYLALKRTRQVGYSSIVGAIINIVINVLLIGKIGLYAASISTAISFLIIAVYRAYDLSKVVKIRYDIKQIIVGITLLGIAEILCYSRNLLSSLICVLIAVVYNAIMNRAFLNQGVRIIKRVCEGRKL